MDYSILVENWPGRLVSVWGRLPISWWCRVVNWQAKDVKWNPACYEFHEILMCQGEKSQAFQEDLGTYQCAVNCGHFAACAYVVLRRWYCHLLTFLEVLPLGTGTSGIDIIVPESIRLYAHSLTGKVERTNSVYSHLAKKWLRIGGKYKRFL